MIRGFWQSKFAAGLILLLTVGLTGAIWVRDQGRAMYIPLVASALMLAIGCLTARLVGNITASNQCTKALGILHMELDPETFVKIFRPVPEKLRQGSRDRAIAQAYLADGYAAAGQFDQAIQALGAPYVPKKKEDPALSGVYYCGLSRYALFAGDLETANSALESLDYVVTRGCSGNPRLAENMQAVYSLLKNQKAAILGQPVDIQWLSGQLEKASYKIRALEILWVLATDAKNRGDDKAANRYLTRMQQEGGKTWFHSWATEQEKALNK